MFSAKYFSRLNVLHPLFSPMWQDHAVPVVASVRGLATAAGCQLVASCDVAIAAHTAKFATPG